MESKGGKKKSSSSSSLLYEVPLGYGIEDVRPHGGIKKFQSAAYSNVSRSKLRCSFFFFPNLLSFICVLATNMLLLLICCSARESHLDILGDHLLRRVEFHKVSV